MSTPLNWKEQNGGARADLGGRLLLLVDWESVKRLGSAEPRWNVYVFGRQMKKRHHTIADAKTCAERIARKWLTQAVNMLDGKGEEADAA